MYNRKKHKRSSNHEEKRRGLSSSTTMLSHGGKTRWCGRESGDAVRDRLAHPPLYIHMMHQPCAIFSGTQSSRIVPHAIGGALSCCDTGLFRSLN